MPSFEKYSEKQITKMIYLGESGAGKTGSLCSLAAAGYDVRILDLDAGVDIVADYLTNPASPYLQPRAGLWTVEQAKSILQRMSYVTLKERVKVSGGKAIPQGKAWQQMNYQLDNWVDGDRQLGGVHTWGSRDVLVIDSFSRACDAAMNFQLAMNGRLGGHPQQQDWGLAQGLVERFLDLLTSDEIKCNIILVCHMTFLETDAGPTKAFPQALGKALPPKVPQKFNHTLLARSSGSGPMAKRSIVTNTSGLIELKNSAPLRVKPEYDLTTGLAEYFRDIRQGQGPGGPKAP